MNGQPEIVTKLAIYAEEGWQMALGWLTSPAAWSQFALLVIAWLLALLAARRLTPRIETLLTPKTDDKRLLPIILLFVLRFLPILLPLLAYGFTALGEAFHPFGLWLGRSHRLRKAHLPVSGRTPFCKPRPA
jgi:potassium efflux system protein